MSPLPQQPYPSLGPRPGSPGRVVAIVDASARVGVELGANLLLAELVGAAVHHRAVVRVTEDNVGRLWPAMMEAEGIDFATVSV